MPIPAIPAAVAGPAIKAGGQLGSALIGRYRPSGVPRTGSTEDRAAAYQRLLDAVAHATGPIFMIRSVQNSVGAKKTDEALTSYMGKFIEDGAEVIAALNGVKLRGTIEVIAAAEAVVTLLGDLNLNEKDDAVFLAAYRAARKAQSAFLDAARTDLGYETKWYQVGRRRAERKFLQRTQEQAPPAIPPQE